MKRTTITLCAAVLSTGCGTTATLLNTLPTLERKTARAPLEAARCVLRNADGVWLPFEFPSAPSLRPGLMPGSYEVVMTRFTEPHAMVTISPEGSGAAMVVYSKGAFALRSGSLSEQLLAGC